MHDGRRSASLRQYPQERQGDAVVAAQGDEVVDCTLRGNRVRRFKDFDQVVLPRPTVRLA